MLSLAAPAETPEPAPDRRNLTRDLLSLLDEEFRIGPWALHGYVQVDAAGYDQAPAGPIETDYRRGEVGTANDGARDLQSGVLLRRVRIGGDGTWGPDIAYRTVFELGGTGNQDEARIAEVWVAYDRFAPWVIQAGAFPQPSNMEDATSASANLFLERATAADIARNLGAGDGRIGVTVKRVDARTFAAISLTGPVIDHAPDAAPRAAIVGRFSRAVRAGPDLQLYLGGSATFVLSPSKKDRRNGVETFPVRLRGPAELRVDETPLIDTGDIDASHARVLGLQFAAQRGRFTAQAEAFRFDIDRRKDTGLPDPHFAGWYAKAAWVLTGERRRYDTGRAAFWFPKAERPVGQGWGVWEVAARYSRMNLNYRAGEEGAAPPPGGVRGGDQKILAGSLEWYPGNRFRFILNVMRVSVDRLNPAGPRNPEPFGPPPYTPPVGVEIGQKYNAVALRARYAF